MHRMILCRSQTDAMSLYRMLNAHGITAVTARPPRGVHLSSCAWGVRIASNEAERAEQVLQEQDIHGWKWLEKM
ncbi:MAG: DUF3343 domain-containing protein [Butyricicoccaceae bacterium]